MFPVPVFCWFQSTRRHQIHQRLPSTLAEHACRVGEEIHNPHQDRQVILVSNRPIILKMKPKE